MLLHSIRLINFQKHEDTKIVLDRGITSIEGRTDVGKSSILRALRWVCLNDFGGDEFIREGATQTEVHLVFAENKTRYVVKRVKGGRENVYYLDDKEFKAFGQSVPKEIATLLRVSDINFQAQHDAPFWFSETAGEVSRKLNAVIDLSVIDTSLSAVASALRTAQERKVFCQEQFEASKAQLSELEWQRLRVKHWERVKRSVSDLEKLHAQNKNFTYLLEEFALNKAKVLQQLADDLTGVFAHARVWRKAIKEVQALTKIVETIEELNQVATAVPDFGPVENAHEAWQSLQNTAERIQTAIDQIQEKETEAERLKQCADEAEKNFHNQASGHPCPFCGRPLPSNKA